MTTSFSHDDVFPIIQRVIATIYQRKQDYVTHDEIIHGLLTDSNGQKAIQAAQQIQRHRTPEQIASNMIAWFSQQITVGVSVYTNSFDRKKVGGKWAYRPVDAVDQGQIRNEPPTAEQVRSSGGASIAVTIADRRFVLSLDQVLTAAQRAMANGVPTEANDYLYWAVEIDGQLVGVKWLLGLVTGVRRTAFDSYQARNALERLGLVVRRIDSPPVPANRAARSFDKGRPPVPAAPTWSSVTAAPTTGPHAILDAQIRAVRDFLAGRASRPSDEKLCDWVHFCYTFELYREADALFQLVDPALVDRWQYERSKRLATICRMKITGRA